MAFMLFFPLPCCGLQQKPICSKGYLLIIWLCKLFGFASLKLVRFVLCLYSLIHHYFQGLITNCFLKMMHWWKCERKITMALFAKKKMESIKKNFINFFFFFTIFQQRYNYLFYIPSILDCWTFCVCIFKSSIKFYFLDSVS